MCGLWFIDIYNTIICVRASRITQAHRAYPPVCARAARGGGVTPPFHAQKIFREAEAGWGVVGGRFKGLYIMANYFMLTSGIFCGIMPLQICGRSYTKASLQLEKWRAVCRPLTFAERGRKDFALFLCLTNICGCATIRESAGARKGGFYGG